ncbi:MAG: hypothetical protein A2W25_06845 [candidate division Zixibacteria bacterium RBG_16_53_22]|nr:MAG: hypothetical protein A2W25_06845 [candidate division Zixibacteria bacterium RBG_16_53_22]
MNSGNIPRYSINSDKSTPTRNPGRLGHCGTKSYVLPLTPLQVALYYIGVYSPKTFMIIILNIIVKIFMMKSYAWNIIHPCVN